MTKTKPVAALLAAIAAWTAVTAATAPTQEPQPVVRTVAYVNPDAQLDTGTIEDWRVGLPGVGAHLLGAADVVANVTTDGVYSLSIVQTTIGQPDGDA